MPSLTTNDIEELAALSETNEAIKGPTFIMRKHWHESNYRSLVQQGLVQWGDPPAGFSKSRFAGIHITVFGKLALDAALAARARSF